MQRFLVAATALFGAVALAGCAGSFAPPQTMFPRFTSYVDPAYRGTQTPVHTVLVAAPKMDLESRRAVENAMAGALRIRGIEPVLGMDVFPPTRGVPTEADVADELRSRGIDFALVFVPTEERVEVQQGVRRVPGTTTERVFVGGRWRDVEVRTERQVPYTVRLPLGSYIAELTTPTGGTAWRTEGSVNSTSTQNGFTALATTAGTAVVQQMQRDGIVPPPLPPPDAPVPTTGPLPPPPM